MSYCEMKINTKKPVSPPNRPGLIFVILVLSYYYEKIEYISVKFTIQAVSSCKDLFKKIKIFNFPVILHRCVLLQSQILDQIVYNHCIIYLPGMAIRIRNPIYPKSAIFYLVYIRNLGSAIFLVRKFAIFIVDSNFPPSILRFCNSR